MDICPVWFGLSYNADDRSCLIFAYLPPLASLHTGCIAKDEERHIFPLVSYANDLPTGEF